MKNCNKHLTLVDVGALGGLEQPWKDHHFKDFIGFEPNCDELVQAKLQEGSKKVFNRALGSHVHEAILYIYGEKGSGSSLLKQNCKWVEENFDSIKTLGNPSLNLSWSKRSKLLREENVFVDTLDNIAAHSGLSSQNPFFAKIDTQGYENNILIGADKVLRDGTCIGLELELFRFPLYDGITLEGEIINNLIGMGFRLVGWTGYKNSFNSQADYLFLKQDRLLSQNSKILVKEIENLYSPKGRSNLIKQNSISSKVFSRFRSLMR